MSLRFQKSVKIIPGLRVNLSKSGLGVSVGGRGLHAGVDAKGRNYTNIGLPGTGLSARQFHHNTNRSQSNLQRAVLIGGVAALVLLLIFVVFSRG